MQKHIQRIDVVVSGLFKVESIFAYLLHGLSFQDFPATLPPPRGRLQAGKSVPIKNKARASPEKMRVRRKVGGQVGLEVAAVQAQGILPLLCTAVVKSGHPCSKKSVQIQDKLRKPTSRLLAQFIPIGYGFVCANGSTAQESRATNFSSPVSQ